MQSSAQASPISLPLQATSLTDTGQKDATSFSVTVVSIVKIRRPPKLPRLAPLQVNEGKMLRVTVQVEDRGTGGGMIRYILRPDPDRPRGATIDEQTGCLTWTPDTAGSYRICVVATDTEDKTLSDETTLSVEVKRLKQPPHLAPIAPRTVAAGGQVDIAVSARDPDTPRHRLRFSLPEKLDWVSINSASGVIPRTPPPEQVDGQYEVTVRVEDDSPSPLSDEQTLTITVAGRQAGFHLVLPSGRKLCDRDLDLRDEAQREAKTLVLKAVQTNARWLCYPGTTSMEVICSSPKGVPVGHAVFFHQNKDPYTCYLNGRRGFDSGKGDFWDDVAVWFYAEYCGGKWCGRVAAWDETGKQTFFGEYKQHRLHGVCCFFQNGELSAVAEYANGEPHVACRIANRRIQGLFDDPKQASALIREVESSLKGENDGFCKAVLKVYRESVHRVHQARQAAADRCASGG